MIENYYYKIIKADTSEELAVIVNKHLREGWEPVGSHKYNTIGEDDDAYGVWSQTMVKG